MGLQNSLGSKSTLNEVHSFANAGCTNILRKNRLPDAVHLFHSEEKFKWENFTTSLLGAEWDWDQDKKHKVELLLNPLPAALQELW